MARPGKVCWFEVNRGDITCQACGARRPISGTYGTPLPAPEENPLQSPTGRDFFLGGETLDTWRITMRNVHMVFGLSFDIVDFITFLYTNFTAVSVDDFVSMTAWIWWFISATQRQWRKKSTTCKRFMKLVSAKRLMIKSIKETNQTPNNAKSGTIITVSQQW